MTAPAPILAPKLAPQSDSGRVGDKLTNDTTPTLYGTGATSSIGVQIWDGVTMSIVGTTTADAAGNWSLTTVPLNDGVHQFYGYAVNAQGERSLAPSGILQVIISTRPPAPPPAPTLDPVSVGSTSPKVNGSGATYNSTLHVYLDGTEVGTTPTAYGTWTYQFGTLAAGTHTVAGQVTDPFGNTGAIGPALTISIAAPISTVPDAPPPGTAHTATETWDTPADGGSPITGYLVTWSVQAQNSVGDSAPSPAVVTRVGP